MGLLLTHNAENTYNVYSAEMSKLVLFKIALPQKAHPTPKYISIESEQGVIVLKDGKIVDFCFAPGIYYIEDASSPACIFGQCDVQTIKSDLFFDYDFSFLGNDTKYIFINFLPITNIPIEFSTPIQYSFNGENFEIILSGFYSIKISDPLSLFQKIVNNNDGEYSVTDAFVDKVTREVKEAILNELSVCSQQNVPPKNLHQAKDAIMQNALGKISFVKSLGFNFVNYGIRSICLTGEETVVEEAPIEQAPEAPATPTSDDAEPQKEIGEQASIVSIDNSPSPQFEIKMPTPIENVVPNADMLDKAESTQEESNENGISFDIDTVEVQNPEGAEMLAQVIPSRQKRELDFDFDFLGNINEEEFSQRPATALRMQIQNKRPSPMAVAIPVEETIIEIDTPTQETSAPFIQPPPNSVDTTVQSLRKAPPPPEAPKEIDMGIEGLNLSLSEMSSKAPENKPQNVTIFSPFGDDNEWLCPTCLNEAIGDFCGFCGQHRATPFHVFLAQQNNSEWVCTTCGARNYLKFCSNCGKSKDLSSTGNNDNPLPPHFCPSCGYNFDKYEGTPKFCPECGFKFP